MPLYTSGNGPHDTSQIKVHATAFFPRSQGKVDICLRRQGQHGKNQAQILHHPMQVNGGDDSQRRELQPGGGASGSTSADAHLLNFAQQVFAMVGDPASLNPSGSASSSSSTGGSLNRRDPAVLQRALERLHLLPLIYGKRTTQSPP
uniref:Uncharacterized protein n=1 Tax=Chromera velia CCMP2878 TaxID=1169474 RepID=A0A0G4H0A2_9ALVE|eukprot:Cvel_24180.t1-p1 / transcript=Cvel_24180.t1 / gene=Cvel_24180 / organism=Chromera_velia_CCMP2878 / gene_product=hypothetical protein / transcript_product=hypothetical protein / location=Cvel_scaffold2580:23768-24205(-) / protein_length=146 / sequence_SO=supercontig / SO=protein_coding / is_pseudo=false